LEILYDKSGQPLPLEQQTFHKQQVAEPKVEPAPTQQPLKEFKEVETGDEFAGPLNDHQQTNPFVQEYLRSKNKPVEPQIEAEAETQVESVNVDPEPEVEIPAKKPDHPNFRALREAAERAERERDEYARLLRERELQDQRYTQKSTRTQDIEQDDLDLPDDGFPEPKHIKKLNQKTKALERELAEYKQKTAKELQESMLYRNYPNLDEVLSVENIEALRTLKPAYARQCKELYDRHDIYAAGELAYNFMVDLGIHKSKSALPTKDYAAEKARVHANAAKPKTLVSGTIQQESPLAKAAKFAGELTEADMKRYYQEMESAIRNRGD
jgi:hypothetical protein